MVTKWDRIAFVLIAVLLVLAIVFWNDISGASNGKGGDNDGDDKKGKKEKKKADKKEADNKSSRFAPWRYTPAFVPSQC
jgi:hypothetical protein